jgi:hypothetical protein
MTKKENKKYLILTPKLSEYDIVSLGLRGSGGPLHHLIYEQHAVYIYISRLGDVFGYRYCRLLLLLVQVNIE